MGEWVAVYLMQQSEAFLRKVIVKLTTEKMSCRQSEAVIWEEGRT